VNGYFNTLPGKHPMNGTKKVRLNKYLADCGVTSRRKADELIARGHTRVNGHVVRDLATQITPHQDLVLVDGRKVHPDTEKIYFMFHKPEHVLTSMSDPMGRPTVGDYLVRFPKRIYPVGRLDWDTEGLLLLTNDGEWAQKVAHPKGHIPKTYMAKVNGQPTVAQLERLKRGVTIPGGRVRADHVERIKKGSDRYDWILIVIGEGKNRQVRFMFQKIGYDVQKLRRVAIGGRRLGSLRKGEFQRLTPRDAAKIFENRHERPKRAVSIKKKALNETGKKNSRHKIA
jgi:23S rRNA pseudouridine2605 synthase